MKALFSASMEYRESTKRYTKLDGMIALGFFVLLMAVYAVMGAVYAAKQIYLGLPVNLSLAAACVVIVLLRRQKLSSIGFTFKRLKRSVIWGLILGVLVSLLNIIPALLSGGRLMGARELLYNLFYYFVVIALVEEIIFRGYVQTRLYGLIKSDLAAVLLGGVLFSAMHIPFQMYNQGVSLLVFLQGNTLSLLLFVLWHIVFDLLYRRLNSLTAPTLMHGLMDFTGAMFR